MCRKWSIYIEEMASQISILSQVFDLRPLKNQAVCHKRKSYTVFDFFSQFQRYRYEIFSIDLIINFKQDLRMTNSVHKHTSQQTENHATSHSMNPPILARKYLTHFFIFDRSGFTSLSMVLMELYHSIRSSGGFRKKTRWVPGDILALHIKIRHSLLNC